MTFQEAQCRLLADLRYRIHNGDLTERGLARISGISQPHVHNVLKGIRFLSPTFLDAILKSLNYSLLDLTTQPELETCTAERLRPHYTFELRMMDSAVGGGMPWPEGATTRRKFSVGAELENSPADLVLARVKFDARMDPALAGCDLAALDVSIRWRTNLSPHGIYVIQHDGETILRYVRPGRSCIYLIGADNLDDPLAWDGVQRAAGGIAAMVRARVVWVGREEQVNLQMRQCGRFLTDATSS